MKQVVHVFVASTKGLVAVQNITDLNDADLQSVITLNGAPDMANISSAYHRFVQKSTGLIQQDFGGMSYRLNLSSNIEQGASWQLGIYLAHYLCCLANNTHSIGSDNQMIDPQCVTLGSGIVKQGDIVFCVTGQVNTTNRSVEGVTAVAEKIIAASAQINQWRKLGALVEFVYPEANVSQHYPSLNCPMHSCMKLNELIEHVNTFLPNAQELGLNAVNSIQQTELSLAYIQNAQTRSAPSHSPDNIHKLLRIKAWYVALSVILLICIFVFFQLQSTSTMANNIEYEVNKKSGDLCDANAQTYRFDISNQYVAQASPVFLDDLCGLYLNTGDSIPQVWMITDTKTVMELAFLESNNGRVWRINLPQYQQTNRQFYLIITEKSLDLSDLASLTDYLGRLPPSKNLSVEVLAEFFTTINVNPQYLSHRLLVQPE